MNVIESNIENIRNLCKMYKVKRLFVFGSVLSDRFKKDSDIDLVVDFQGVELYDYADNYFDFKQSLQTLLKREIDLLEDKAINNPYLRQSIDSSKLQLYGQWNRIAHGYDKISDDLIWSIVINHLPKLKEEISTLFEQ